MAHDDYKFSSRLPENDEEWQTYWKAEFEAARTHRFKKFQKDGQRVYDRFLGESRLPNGAGGAEDDLGAIGTKLNIFNSNVTILLAMLYGRMPKVEVSRRFADSDDDVARVAGLILTRMLNNDIEVAGEDMMSTNRNALQDRLLPGLGTARVRYEFEEAEKELEEDEVDALGNPVLDESGAVRKRKVADVDEEGNPVLDENGDPVNKKESTIVDEWTDIAYCNWMDVLFSPARTHEEIRWKAYRNYFGRRQFKKEFPDADIDRIAFESKGPLYRSDRADSDKPAAPQTEVWEIWDKDTKQVFWFSESAVAILRKKEDFLRLEGFFQEPPPMVANVTTQNFLPKSDYEIAKDLYQAINTLETRINMLTEACKLRGVYNKAIGEIKRIFNEGVENDLIPVDDWAAFSEKGGLEGNVIWLPIKEVAEVIQLLTDKQEQKIQQLQQITGMSDVMRGAQTEARKSAAATKLEATFGSVRMEALQNEFARWVTDCQNLKVEIICKHYQPYCILKQSNILLTTDAQFAEAAVQMIKDYDATRWRIIVRPESLAIADYAQLKQDRSEFLMGLAQFMQSAAPLLELSPNALPTLLKLLKWYLAGFRGSAEAEGILDAAISQFEKQPPKDKGPDPAVMKAQTEMKIAQEEHQAKLQQMQMQAQQKMTEAQQKFELSVAQMQMEMQQDREKHTLEMTALRAKLNADVTREVVQAQTAIAENESAAKVPV